MPFNITCIAVNLESKKLPSCVYENKSVLLQVSSVGYRFAERRLVKKFVIKTI